MGFMTNGLNQENIFLNCSHSGLLPYMVILQEYICSGGVYHAKKLGSCKNHGVCGVPTREHDC